MKLKGAGRASQALSNIPHSGTPHSGQISVYQNIPHSGTPHSGQISAYPLPFLAKVQTIPHTRVQEGGFNKMQHITEAHAEQPNVHVPFQKQCDARNKSLTKIFILGKELKARVYRDSKQS